MCEVKKYQYKIVLAAPIGDRKGFAAVEIFGNQIEGNLAVMNHDNHFCGKRKNDDTFEIAGCIRTLTGIVDYHGSGFLGENGISFLLETERQKMILSGEILHIGDDEI